MLKQVKLFDAEFFMEFSTKPQSTAEIESAT